MGNRKPRKLARLAVYSSFTLGVVILVAIFVLLRFSIVTDHMYSALVKDPERVIPQQRAIVSPADGTVLYVKSIDNGVIPEIVKRGVEVPVAEHIKTSPQRPIEDGFLVGIYMNTHGVHINRNPLAGTLVEQTIFNGPHMDMTRAETRIILTQLIPGWVTLKKLIGLPPYAIENDADFILKSARETLAIHDVRDRYIYVTRIADYYVGKILTWVKENQQVKTGQKLGLITWGSQTDILVESSPGIVIKVKPGDQVYGGEGIIATY
jgi:phosphatidylserine decarboxylase